jgi:hypothetical protein
MNEAYLQYIWRYKRLPLKGLHLNDGRPFELLDFGTYNTNSGADFFNAKIKIGRYYLGWKYRNSCKIV